MKHYRDESIIDSYNRDRLEREKKHRENMSLDDKLKAIKNNFDISDKLYGEFSSLKFKLDNERLLMGEFRKYQRELIELKSKLFDVFKTTWKELIMYSTDIPSKTFKTYSERFKIYDYNVKRHSFNGTIFDDN